MTHLQVEPTTHCNFTCEFCCGRRMDQSELTASLYARLLDTFPEAEWMELHGEGEPLMHAGFFDMAALAAGRGLKVSTITNGSLLSKSNIERILASGLNSVLISIESADPDQFRTIRGGKLARVLRGAGQLIQMRNQRGLSLPVVGLSVTVLRSTRDQLPAVAKLYEELGMDGGMPVHMLNPMPYYKEVYGDSVARELLSGAEQALVWARGAHITRSLKFSSIRTQFWDGLFGSDADSGEGEPEKRTPAKKYRSCPWLDHGLYVDRHGDATGCPRIKDPGRFGFGNIARDDRCAIVRSRDRLGGEVRGGELPAACGGCFIAESIANRLGKLRDKKPARVPGARAASSAWSDRGGTGIVGRVPYDAAWIEGVANLCDGRTSSTAIASALGRRWKVDESEARQRTLPVINELVRTKVIRV